MDDEAKYGAKKGWTMVATQFFQIMLLVDVISPARYHKTTQHEVSIANSNVRVAMVEKQLISLLIISVINPTTKQNKLRHFRHREQTTAILSHTRVGVIDDKPLCV